MISGGNVSRNSAEAVRSTSSLSSGSRLARNVALSISGCAGWLFKAWALANSCSMTSFLRFSGNSDRKASISGFKRDISGPLASSWGWFEAEAALAFVLLSSGFTFWGFSGWDSLGSFGRF